MNNSEAETSHELSWETYCGTVMQAAGDADRGVGSH